MADDSLDLKQIERRMTGAVEALRTEFVGLRTGRASTGMLDPVTVEVYGSMMPINQVGTVSAPEPRMLTVQVWDASNMSAVEKAIRNAGLGLNPMVDGQLLRIPVPELNEERRRELTKVAAKYAEAARVAVRNVRRDGLDTLKTMEKDKSMSEDAARGQGEKVQQLTDAYVKEIDEALATKEKEIMQV